MKFVELKLKVPEGSEEEVKGAVKIFLETWIMNHVDEVDRIILAQIEQKKQLEVEQMKAGLQEEK